MRAISLLIGFVVVNTLYAKDLDLHSCIEKALLAHPDIQKFSLVLKNSQKASEIAHADYLPQVTLSAEYDPLRTYTLPANGIFNIKESDGWAVGGTVNQIIWDFSKTTSNIEAKKVDEEIANLNLADAKALLAYKVKLQYEMMLVQTIAIDVRKKDLHLKEELYKQAEAFVKNGMRTQAEASRFLSSIYVAQENLAIAEAAYKKAKAILSLYINETIDEDVVLKNSFETFTQMSFDETQSLQNSPTLLSAKKGVQKSKFTYKSVQATHYGSIDAVVSYTKQNTLNEYDSSLIAVTYKIPLYSGGRTSALVEQSSINMQSAVAELHSKELALKEEYTSLLIDIQRYEKTIQAKEAQLEASQQTEMVLQARYKEGLATYIEVLDAVALTLNSRLGVLQAQYERSSALHRIEYLQGRSL